MENSVRSNLAAPTRCHRWQSDEKQPALLETNGLGHHTGTACAEFCNEARLIHPPTGSDLSTPGYGGYAGGVVALHDGDVYYYSCRGAAPFNGHSFDAHVESCRKKGIVQRRRSRRLWTITQTASASNGRSYDR